MTGEPYIPERIVVHLGAPEDASAMNVTVNFTDYIKNVGSSEIFPTWPAAALRANLYAITTYALNRFYTEWYPSKGYDFDITNDIRYDQYYVHGRDIFEPISNIADEIFNNYVRRQGTVQPMFTAYCDGRQTNCAGLKQWGTAELAEKGYTALEILKYYYGDDIEIVTDAPVGKNTPSYPGKPLVIGSAGEDVLRIQNQLNRISRNYPAIPRIAQVTGAMDTPTADAVEEFQRIFNLTVTGEVDKATWYKINQIYNGVKQLAELRSEGVTLSDISADAPRKMSRGQSGADVRAAQYILSVIGAYYDAVPRLSVTGEYGPQTENAVRAFQQIYGLPPTGIIDGATWEDMYRAYKGIVDSIPLDPMTEEIVLYPGYTIREGMQSDYVRVLQRYLTVIHRSHPQVPEVSDTGYFGPVTRGAVLAFQRIYGINPTGMAGPDTWNRIAEVYSEIKYGSVRPAGQYPGYTIKKGG